MHGQDRLRLRRDSPPHVVRVEVHRRRVDLGEDRGRPPARDRLGRRVERERRGDHLVPRSDPERVEGQHQGVGPVRDADRVLDAEVRRGLLLEGPQLRAEDEPARVEDFGDSLLQLVQQRRVLRLDVNERDLRHGAPV
jgi:hypothetical protein